MLIELGCVMFKKNFYFFSDFNQAVLFPKPNQSFHKTMFNCGFLKSYSWNIFGLETVCRNMQWQKFILVTRLYEAEHFVFHWEGLIFFRKILFSIAVHIAKS